MPTITDFSRSYVRWSIPPDPNDHRLPGHMPWGNSVRIQIDALCTVTDRAGGEEDVFYLIAPCRKEWMYRETELIMDPGGEYRVIFSRERQLDVAMSSRLDDRPLPPFTAAFTSLDFEIATLPASRLESNEAVVRASQGSAPIVARTAIANAERGLSAVLEYPIRTMNFHPERQRFQVDTGPLIFPDLSLDAAHPIERCTLAHTVYNTFDYAEFVCRSAAPPVAGDVVLSHYAEIYRLDATHWLYQVSSL